MINRIINFFKKTPGTGALIDTRPEEEKIKDYHFEEIVTTFNPVNWVEKNKCQWRKFPIFNQDGSGSCVAQTMAKIIGIMYWLKNQVYVHFSATHIYQRRVNAPGAGMAGVDAFDIACKGTTLEELTPSQKMTDVQMDSVEIPEYKKRVGEVFKISSNYLQLPKGNIDAVASVIQTTGKAVMVWFFFKRDEWTSKPKIKYPKLQPWSPDISRHSVTAVDYSIVDGKKCLIIEDSWGTSYGLAGQRVISEDFFKSRNFFAAYPMNFAFDSNGNKPKYNFRKMLKINMTDPDVVELQNVLKYEKVFPSNVGSTGFYGAITARAVYEFQKKHKVASASELDELQGRVVGPKTLAKLNELYNQ